MEALEPRNLLAAVPYGAADTDLGEFLLGDVNVTVVFIESSPTSANTETWTPAQIASVKATINAGLQWWEDTLHAYFPQAPLDFHADFTHADNPFEVPFEPISRISDQHVEFVGLFLQSKGFNSGEILAFNHSQRVARETNWSFTIFVVNNAIDDDKMFAFGGSFRRAFAFPGGQYIVMPADRPAEIISHELGHIFWAFDEYSTGDHHTARRGYYNQQNTNGLNGAPGGFVQQTSIMASPTMVTQSYLSHTIPAATRAHVGWRDSDADGIIDLLDVPMSLTGRGFVDQATGDYRFLGTSKVRTFPNFNQAGNKNDITINRVRLAEYRLDGGAWLAAGTYDTYSAELDLTIDLPFGINQIEIRTRDTVTGVTSDVFTAQVATPITATTSPGINGMLFNDANNNGVWDAGEGGLGNRVVRLVDASGNPIAGPVLFDPDNYALESNIATAIPGVTLSVVGDQPSQFVLALDGTYGSTTTRVFGAADDLLDLWSSNKRLKIAFANPVYQVSLEALGVSPGDTSARFEIYNASNQLMGRFTANEIAQGERRVMTLSSLQPIAYAIAQGHNGKFAAFDRLRIGAPVSTTTDAYGAYSLSYLASGTYRVQALAPTDWEATSPASGIQQVNFTAGQTHIGVHFGQHLTVLSWHNSVNRFDVNNDSLVTPLDALLVILDLNARGPRALTTPPSGEDPPTLIDVNGDGLVTPLDALEVILHLNSGGAGEGEDPSGSSGGSSGGGNFGPPQGEPPLAAVTQITGAVFSTLDPRAFELPGRRANAELSAAPRYDAFFHDLGIRPALSSAAARPTFMDAWLSAGASGSDEQRSSDEDELLPGDLLFRRQPLSTLPADPRPTTTARYVPELDEAHLSHLAAEVAATRAQRQESEDAEEAEEAAPGEHAAAETTEEEPARE